MTVAWHAYQQLRSIYQAGTSAEGRRVAEQVIGSFLNCPIPEVARLGRTLRQWRQHVLARFDTHRISNGGAEAVNLIIEKTRRLAHGGGLSEASNGALWRAAIQQRRLLHPSRHPP